VGWKMQEQNRSNGGNYGTQNETPYYGVIEVENLEPENEELEK